MAALALPGSGLGSSQPGSAACAKPSCLGGNEGCFGSVGKGLSLSLSHRRMVGAPGRAAPVLLVLVAPGEMLRMLLLRTAARWAQ